MSYSCMYLTALFKFPTSLILILSSIYYIFMLNSTLKLYFSSGFDFDKITSVGDMAKCMTQCSNVWTKTQDQQEFAECSSNCTNAAFSFQANAFITVALIFVFYLFDWIQILHESQKILDRNYKLHFHTVHEGVLIFLK